MTELFVKKQQNMIVSPTIKDPNSALPKRTNSTENMFMMISQKQKNTMILEPLQFGKRDAPSEEDEAIGSGLQNRMRRTDYKGFRKDQAKDNSSFLQVTQDGSQSPSKVMRTWSKPVLN